MIRVYKSKIYKIILPFLIFIINISTVFADDVTDKLTNGKKWLIGVLEIAAAINLAIAVYLAGSAKTQGEIESTTKYRKNAIGGFIGVTMINVFIGLWNSW